MKRKNIRRLMICISMLLFPVTLYYFSPALVFNGAFHKTMNGSFIVFSLMFVLSIPFGRLFCGYLCPAGGIQECMYGVNEKVPKKGKKDYIKLVIWVLWFGGVIICYIKNGIEKADPFFQTEHGVSLSDKLSYIIYYGIICLIVIPSVIGGKRMFCRCFCWMAPFMMIGTKLRQKTGLPGLHIGAGEGCISCGKCTGACPMGINVKDQIKHGRVDSLECILCGSCTEACPKKVLKYEMRYKNDRKKT